MTLETQPTAPHLEERVAALDHILSGLNLPGGRLTEVALQRIVIAVAGRPELFDDLVVADPAHRWWLTLREADNFDLRVLSWEHDQTSDWHDHGGSAGAYVVTRGSLRERFRAADGVTVSERVAGAGKPVAFEPAHVHDVTYASGSPAVSIHAYSPPLSGLTYYDHGPLGFVAREVVPEESRRAFELAR